MPKSRRRGRPPGPTPRYKSIVAGLTQRMESGQFPIGKPIPSCRQLALKYGVGAKTVWRALKELQRDGRLQVSAGRTSIATRRIPLSSVMENAVAIVIKVDLASLAGIGFPKGIGHGILKTLSKTRTTCLVLQDIRWWRHDCPQGLRDMPIKGILIPGPFPHSLLKEYESMGVPIVLIDQPGDDLNVHSVTVDNYRAAFDAASKLIERGHRQIAFVRSVISNIRNIDPDAKERQEGFLAACRKARLSRRQYGIFSATFDNRSPSIDNLLRASPRYTGVLSAGEVHAGQISVAAKAAGIKIPRDLAVVTFRDAQPQPLDWSGPTIDFEEMGRVATELLQRAPSTIQHLRFKTEWHEGSTLVPPRR